MSSSFFHPLIARLGSGRTRDIIQDIEPFLKTEQSILEIGAGTCQVTHQLEQQGFHVTPLDVIDKSIIKTIKPIVYDGQILPFSNKSFDVAMLLNVLHHIPDPEHTLKEAARVANLVIISEDVYKTSTQKYLTFAMDSLTNMEFIGHPHSNKTDQQWKETFTRLGYTLSKSQYKHFWLCFQNGLYILKTS